MVQVKKLLAVMLTAVLVLSAVPAAQVTADGTGEKVVTLGADLSGEQKDMMLKYFGIEGEDIKTLTVTNADEREFLENYVPLEEIGTRTISCALVKPTSSGGIQVKTANLTWVTSNMIASTLSTCGVVNCQVLAASPIAVSGTGALTGVIMSYEESTGRKLDRNKVRAANRELIVTGRLGERIGPPRATLLVNRAKIQVIEGNVTNVEDITNIVNNITYEYNLNITQEDTDLLVELLEEISKLDYELDDMMETLERVEENVTKQIEEEEAETDILDATDDAALGEDAVFDSTKDLQTLEIKPETEAENETEEDTEKETETETEEDTENILDDTDDSALGDDAIIDTTEETEPAPKEEETESETETGTDKEESIGFEILIEDSYSSGETETETEAETETEETVAPSDPFDVFTGSGSKSENNGSKDSSAPDTSDDIFDAIFEDTGSSAEEDIAAASDIASDDDSSPAEETSAPADSSDGVFDTIFEDSAVLEPEESAEDQTLAGLPEDEDLPEDAEDAETETEAEFTAADLKLIPGDEDDDEPVDPDLDVLKIKCSTGTLSVGSGTLTIYTDDDTKIEEIFMDDEEKVEVHSDEIDVYFDTELSGNTSYYVILSDDALRLDGVSLTEFEDTDWTFETSEAESSEEE